MAAEISVMLPVEFFHLGVSKPTLDFASSAYVHSLSSTQYKRLVICSHLAMKNVFGLDRLTPTSAVLRY